MTNEELLKALLTLFQRSEQANDGDSDDKGNDDRKVEMLTVKECVQAVQGLSEHTIRQLVAQKKIPFIRTGQGKRGKILINKQGLLDYLA